MAQIYIIKIHVLFFAHRADAMLIDAEGLNPT